MLSFDDLIELCGYACEPWGGFGLGAPTAASVERITGELDTALPVDLVRLAVHCPTYGSWFAGLGEDYDHALHILNLNREFHRADPDAGSAALPDHLVLLNHGHDGDCDCLDRRHLDERGEYPIVYVTVNGEVSPPVQTYGSFVEYLTAFCHAFAESTNNRAHRRRARTLLGRDRDHG